MDNNKNNKKHTILILSPDATEQGNDENAMHKKRVMIKTYKTRICWMNLMMKQQWRKK